MPRDTMDSDEWDPSVTHVVVRRVDGKDTLSEKVKKLKAFRDYSRLLCTSDFPRPEEQESIPVSRDIDNTGKGSPPT